MRTQQRGGSLHWGGPSPCMRSHRLLQRPIKMKISDILKINYWKCHFWVNTLIFAKNGITLKITIFAKQSCKTKFTYPLLPRGLPDPRSHVSEALRPETIGLAQYPCLTLWFIIFAPYLLSELWLLMIYAYNLNFLLKRFFLLNYIFCKNSHFILE